MLKGEEDQARRAVARPVVGERGAAAFGVAEAAGRAKREVALVVNDRIANVRMLVVVPRQQDRGAEEDRMSPPFGKRRALELDALDVFVIVRHDDGWDHLVGRELDRRATRRIPVHLYGLPVEVAGRALP